MPTISGYFIESNGDSYEMIRKVAVDLKTQVRSITPLTG